VSRLKPLWIQLGAIARQLRSSHTLEIACDYDGTLTEIVDHPTQAALSSRAHSVLERLARARGVRIAILSGRSLDDLARCIDIPGLFLAGVAGLETQDEFGTRTTFVERENELPQELRTELGVWCDRFPGAWLEDKGLALALHYRAVAPAQQAAYGAGVRRRVREHEELSVLVHGKRVFEVLPAVERDKSAALDGWLRPTGTQATVFYFGDDANDEPALERIRRHGGITVAVGAAVSRAEYRIESPREVVWFLEWLEREWSASQGAIVELSDAEAETPLSSVS
jgi:trehalose 6-phosphate phosphatase